MARAEPAARAPTKASFRVYRNIASIWCTSAYLRLYTCNPRAGTYVASMTTMLDGAGRFSIPESPADENPKGEAVLSAVAPVGEERSTLAYRVRTPALIAM